MINNLQDKFKNLEVEIKLISGDYDVQLEMLMEKYIKNRDKVIKI